MSEQFLDVSDIDSRHCTERSRSIPTYAMRRACLSTKVRRTGNYDEGRACVPDDQFPLFFTVLLSDHSSKFTVIPKRWVVERTFAWFESYRRLSKDFEYLADTSEAMIQFAMLKLMLNRIKK